MPPVLPTPIWYTVDGNVTLVRLVQLWNTREEITVTPSGIVILVRFVHPLNA